MNDQHDYVPDCECRDCLLVTLRDTVAAAERLALERAEFRRDAERLQEELAELRAQEPVAYHVTLHGKDRGVVLAHSGLRFDTDKKYQPLYAAHAPAATQDFPWTQVPDWLDEAAYDIAEWGAYASECWQKKHNLAWYVSVYQNRASSLRRAMLAAAQEKNP